MMTKGIAVRLGALVAATAIWGWTFVVVKDSVSAYPIAAFLAYRFLLAFAVFLPFVKAIRWDSVRAGLPIGLAMGIAFVVQTVGLHLSLVSDTGLITGLFVVAVPLMEWVWFRVPVSRVTLAGLGLAVAGLALLTGRLPRQLALGDLLAGASAIGFAVQIILLSRRSPHHDAVSLTLGQTAGAAGVFLVAALSPTGGGLPVPPTSLWPALAITGVVATAIACLVQVWAQADLPATPAALVLLTEAAWATLFGIVLSGNPFPPIRVMGAVFLFLTPVLITLASRRSAKRARQEKALSAEIAALAG